MLNFTIGPVQSSEVVLREGAKQLPYFRTKEFSAVMKENEGLIKEFMKAEENSNVIFMTGSGTASMEAAVMNLFSDKDRVIVINGGTFGQRFVDLCNVHGINYYEIKIEAGEPLTKEMLEKVENPKSYDGLLINMHETSTGVLYDMKMVGEFCEKNNLLYVVDAISAFLADELKMKEWGIDAVITGSQKALALPPGLSIITVNEKAKEVINGNKVKSLYFDLKDYLRNGERGQTPYTPAVGIVFQLNKRLKEIQAIGLEKFRENIEIIANDFRNKIKNLPLEIFSKSLSNAETSLTTTSGVSAYSIFEILKDEYDIFVCPNGGDLADKVFRVGHMGALTLEDNATLINALNDMKRRGML